MPPGLPFPGSWCAETLTPHSGYPPTSGSQKENEPTLRVPVDPPRAISLSGSDGIPCRPSRTEDSLSGNHHGKEPPDPPAPARRRARRKTSRWNLEAVNEPCQMEGRPFASPGAPPIPLDCRLKGIRVSRNHDSAPVLQTVAVKDSQRLPTSPSASAGPVDPMPPCCTLYKRHGPCQFAQKGGPEAGTR